jgi:hypothetical protein
MTNYQQKDSGLILPQEKPKRKYGPLEIQDEAERELAREAMSKLWDAMGLSRGRGSLIHGDAGNVRYEAYRLAYEMVGDMTLGQAPQKEVFT